MHDYLDDLVCPACGSQGRHPRKCPYSKESKKLRAFKRSHGFVDMVEPPPLVKVRRGDAQKDEKRNKAAREMRA